MRRSQQVPSYSKEILNDTMSRQESLCLARRFESTHLALALSRRLMRQFRNVEFRE
jgi:hypothetical protein